MAERLKFPVVFDLGHGEFVDQNPARYISLPGPLIDWRFLIFSFGLFPPPLPATSASPFPIPWACAFRIGSDFVRFLCRLRSIGR